MPSTEQPSLREIVEERTRQEFQRIALELFRRHGFEHVTVDDIAREATTSRGTSPRSSCRDGRSRRRVRAGGGGRVAR